MKSARSSTIATFGEAGENYYKLSKSILEGKGTNTSERLNNNIIVRSKTVGVATKGGITG